MKSNLTVTVGICAYNSQDQIESLLKSLIRQKKSNFDLKQITVHCDKSQDNTALVTKNWVKEKNLQKLIKIIEPSTRLGFAGSLLTIINKSQTDILIILNDDIKIKDLNFLTKISRAFKTENNLGLACINLEHLSPRSFIEEAIIVSINAYKATRVEKNGGNNLFTCDGKVLVLSKRFYQKLTFPKNLAKVGNVDTYLYFSCLKHRMSYLFLNNISVFHHSPATFREYLSWTSRNNSNYPLLKKSFGKIVDREFELPRFLLLRQKLIHFFKYPLHCSFLFLTSYYIKYLTLKQAKNFNPKWETLLTTKAIN